MSTPQSSFEKALALIDSANSQDPNCEIVRQLAASTRGELPFVRRRAAQPAQRQVTKYVEIQGGSVSSRR